MRESRSRARPPALLRLQWEGYRRHPWLAQTLSMTRPQALKNGMRHTEAILEALNDLRLGDQAHLTTAVSLIAYVRGMAVSLEQEAQAEQDSGMSREEWMNSQTEIFSPLMKELPVLSRLSNGPDFDVGNDALFECGMGYLLDGIARKTRRL